MTTRRSLVCGRPGACSEPSPYGEAASRVFPGFPPPSDELGGDLPYPMDRVERALFDDVMGAGIRITDPALATALRHTMRLLEDTADAAGLVRSLLDRPAEESPGGSSPARTNQNRQCGRLTAEQAPPRPR
ncbi:hypothetical protein [Streptomyces albipurpureus]|uniref:Uncharacterized protein n=1 Tax=Streptomyces albipurpureus TaxID=2897419 RepID=A0ABT0V4V1_9ACTN|nr:hypothetical protein [Streptomyces sp. CWNU-1]MCM2394406.1 hypothetical protein [Streptomyces sp. CWNU-1]